MSESSALVAKLWNFCNAMMACLFPRPGETVADPASGTGGFLLAAHEWVVDHGR